MKPVSKKSFLLGLTTLGMVLSLASPVLASADDAEQAIAPQAQQEQVQTNAQGRHRHWRHKHGKNCFARFKKRKRAFRLGLCVGEALAKDNITLPKPVPGQRPEWDKATKEAFKAAIKECRSEFKAEREAAKAEKQNPTS